ncbi:uncharacterized protein LOC111694076 [Trichogramma pretiosum]|uniref:uncharacterized protein LOC111694076 n=1 Tax=Trichogramma pretiosum TaxID=7493 RepID=UPI000C71A150|nr:uncharacterized protein LOC111694076 [Trichogramma pretiosum]
MMPAAITSARISTKQDKDDQLLHLLLKPRVKCHKLTIDGHLLWYVEGQGDEKPYLPVSLKRKAFDAAHHLPHPSGRVTAKRVALHYFWPSLRKDVVHWAKQCVPHCEDADVPGLPELSHDYRYMRWPQAISLADISAPKVTKVLFAGWISLFSTPLTITTNQGGQFESRLLAELGSIVGAKHVHTTPHQPKGNGMIERMH